MDPISLLSSLASTSPTFGKAPTPLPRLRLLQIPPDTLQPWLRTVGSGGAACLGHICEDKGGCGEIR